MKVNDLITRISENKKASKIIMFIGIAGMVFIMISSFFPESSSDNLKSSSESKPFMYNYLEETEKRLEDFLESMEGVGNVKVMIMLEGEEFYIYAREGKKIVSDNKTETDENYVMSGRDKTPLLETVNNPQIKGAVIACDGASSPAVKEKVYDAVSTVLGISSYSIYITELK